MTRLFLLMVVSALLVMLGFAQTPGTGSNTDQINVKGCLGGSDGNYTVAEDGTRQIFKITTSSVDLKPHVGHDVKLIGHKASGAVSSGAADNSFAVTELNMISEHCAAAAAAPAVTAMPSSETVIAPAAAAAATTATVSTPASDATAPAAPVSPSSATVGTPAANAAAPAPMVSPSPATVSTPAADAAAPAASVTPSPATVSTLAVDTAAPAPTVSSSSVSAPAANASHPTRRSAHPRKLSATKAAASAAAASPSSDTVSPPAADAATPAATASPSSKSDTTPATTATKPAVTHRGVSFWLLSSFAVLVIVLGTLAPVLSRWRKRKILERTGTPNLSLTNEASPDQDKPELRKVA